jgi:hypothetical protein
MIRYDKGWWGIKVLARMYGSAFPKALPLSILASLIAGFSHYFFFDALDGTFSHPYPFAIFAFIVGFMVVFRCAPSPCSAACRVRCLQTSSCRRQGLTRAAVPR